MNKKNILIAGCGDVGGELAKQLLRSKYYNVWGVRRNTDQLPAGVQPLVADLSHPDTFKNWPKPVDYVVYSAAADGHSPDLYRQAYVNGLLNVIRHLNKTDCHPSRILFTSSTSVYHQSYGEWLDEKSACKPDKFSGQIILEAEKTLFTCGIPATSIRFGGIYGPGRNRLVSRVLEGKGCPESPIIFSNRIHRDDCAGILSWLIQQDIAEKEIASLYLAVDDCPVPLYDVLHWMAEQKNNAGRQPLSPSTLK